MTSRSRNILIILGVMTAIGIAVVGYGGYKIYSIFTQFGVNRDVPPELQEPRVTTGAGLLRRSDFFRLEGGGILKAMGEGSTIGDEKERKKKVNANISRGIYNYADLRVIGDEVVAVSEFGGFVFDLNGNLKKEIYFEPATEKIKIGPYEHETYLPGVDNIRIVELARDRIGFLSFGIMQGVRVFDENGNQIWAYGKEDLDLAIITKDADAEYEKSNYVLEAAVGDLDGDGISEYLIARKNEGIRAFDQAGNERWFQTDEFPSARLEVVDIDNDGKREVLEIGKGIRDSDGKRIHEMKGSDSDAFLIVEAKGQRSKLEFAKFRQGELIYYTESGEDRFRSQAPLSWIKKEAKKVEVPGYPEMSHIDDDESVAYPKAIWVRLRPNEPKLLAVIAGFIGLPRSNFYVYDEGGQLVYHELLPEEADTIALLPSADGREEILIGGKDTIWRFAAN